MAEGNDLDRPAMAVFAAPNAWWREMFERLDVEQRRKLVDGRLTMTVLADDGVATMALEVPEDLRVEFVYRVS